MRRQVEMDREADRLLQRVEFVEIDEIFLHDVALPAAGCRPDGATDVRPQTAPSARPLTSVPWRSRQRGPTAPASRRSPVSAKLRRVAALVAPYPRRHAVPIIGGNPAADHVGSGM